MKLWLQVCHAERRLQRVRLAVKGTTADQLRLRVVFAVASLAVARSALGKPHLRKVVHERLCVAHRNLREAERLIAERATT